MSFGSTKPQFRQENKFMSETLLLADINDKIRELMSKNNAVEEKVIYFIFKILDKHNYKEE
jgi:hypothetical protein